MVDHACWINIHTLSSMSLNYDYHDFNCVHSYTNINVVIFIFIILIIITIIIMCFETSSEFRYVL